MSDPKPPLTPAQLASAIRTAMDRGATLRIDPDGSITITPGDADRLGPAPGSRAALDLIDLRR